MHLALGTGTGRYTYVNDLAVQLLGKSRGSTHGQSVWICIRKVWVPMFTTNVCKQWPCAFFPLQFEAFFPDLKRWYENDLYPTSEGLADCWRDHNGPQAGEEKLRRSEAYLAEAQRSPARAVGPGMLLPENSFWSREHFHIFGLILRVLANCREHSATDSPRGSAVCSADAR